MQDKNSEQYIAYTNFTSAITTYFGKYSSTEKLNFILEYVWDNVAAVDLPGLFDQLKKEVSDKFGPPGIKEIEAAYSDQRKRGVTESQKRVTKTRNEERQHKTKTEWDSKRATSVSLQAGDVFAICWIMTAPAKYLKALKDKTLLSAKQIREFESQILQAHMTMMKDAIDSPDMPLVRDSKTYFEKIVYPSFRHRYGRDRLIETDPLPRSRPFGISFDKCHTIMPA
jgi:hypothetical protein